MERDQTTRSVLAMAGFGLAIVTWMAVRALQDGHVGLPATCELSREATGIALFALFIVAAPFRSRMANVQFSLVCATVIYVALRFADRAHLIAEPTNCEIARLTLSFCVPILAGSLIEEAMRTRRAPATTPAIVGADDLAAFRTLPTILVEGFAATLKQPVPAPPLDQATKIFPGADGSQVAVCIEVVDPETNEWRTISVNKAFESVTGYSRHEAEGRSPIALLQLTELNPDKVADFETDPQKVDGGRDLFLIRRRDGQIVEVEATSSLMGYAGEPASFLVVLFHDVGARKQLEQERWLADQKLAVATLTRGVAHDFHNTISIINSNSEVLTRLLSSEEQRQLVERILHACDHASDIVASLVDYSKQQMLAPRRVDLVQAIRHAAALIRAILPANISIDVRGEGAFTTYLDRPALERCLVNLAINSRDAMPHGGRLTIELAEAKRVPAEMQLHAASGVACISVTDNGAGMSRDTQRRALEPFFTTKEKGSGFGLGLGLVHSFVRESGGAMYIESELGIGTVVALYIPLIAEN